MRKIVTESSNVIDIDKVTSNDTIVVKSWDDREVGEVGYNSKGVYFLKYSSHAYKPEFLREIMSKYPDLGFYVKEG